MNNKYFWFYFYSSVCYPLPFIFNFYFWNLLSNSSWTKLLKFIRKNPKVTQLIYHQELFKLDAFRLISLLDEGMLKPRAVTFLHSQNSSLASIRKNNFKLRPSINHPIATEIKSFQKKIAGQINIKRKEKWTESVLGKIVFYVKTIKNFRILTDFSF